MDRQTFNALVESCPMVSVYVRRDLQVAGEDEQSREQIAEVLGEFIDDVQAVVEEVTDDLDVAQQRWKHEIKDDEHRENAQEMDALPDFL